MKGIKFIKETQDRYGISKNGYIVNMKTQKKFLGIMRNNGYLSFCVWQPKLQRNQRLDIHVLVAKYWVKNPNNLPLVMHIDNNKINNHYLNLKWGTNADNSEQMSREGRGRSGKEIKTYLLNKDGSLSEEFISMKSCFKALGITTRSFENKLKKNSYFEFNNQIISLKPSI